MADVLYPEDIKKYNKTELIALCDSVRNKIYDTVMNLGGHLASNLGAIEPTVALCYVFDFPHDKIVFDVGHQCYAYKLLTGRGDRFDSLRRENGISGFPKRSESIYDFYDTGHAGTSVSAALGMAKARDLSNDRYETIAFIGDGSFNNGLVYEALCSLKILKTNILIILNDNGMSISETVGGMHEILDGIRNGDEKERIRLLENFGLTYQGIVDGNDVCAMVDALENAKELLKTGSVLLHITTVKGKGYSFSEENPKNTHGVNPMGCAKEKEYSVVLGETLSSIAKKNEKITVVTAAMTDALGLRDFFTLYPERSFDVGICEENASVLCASMATCGLKPYYAIYSTFLQRAFDEIVHDVCSQNLPVTFCIDRAGISGTDGETHQGVFDLSYLSLIPNMTIAVPKDIEEFKRMLAFSAEYPLPLAIRYPRAGKTVFESTSNTIEKGKWEVLKKSDSKVFVLGAGERCLSLAMRLWGELEEKGKTFTIVNARFVKPLDEEFLKALDGATVVTLEDNVKKGGFGESVLCAFNRLGVCADTRIFAYKDAFIKQGFVNDLQREYGVSYEEIKSVLLQIL